MEVMEVMKKDNKWHGNIQRPDWMLGDDAPDKFDDTTTSIEKRLSARRLGKRVFLHGCSEGVIPSWTDNVGCEGGSSVSVSHALQYVNAHPPSSPPLVATQARQPNPRTLR
jgi:hypothetical protein